MSLSKLSERAPCTAAFLKGDPMPFTVQSRGDVVVVKIHVRRLDAHVASEFKTKLVHLVQSGHERIVMDMAALEFIDSSGLGALIAGLKALGGRGEMVLCGITPRLLSLFTLTHVDKLLQIFDSLEEAVGGLATSA
jgi:anti-sigma B factor antagonist